MVMLEANQLFLQFYPFSAEKMPKCFPWCKCISRKGKKKGKGLVDDDGMYNEGAIPLIGGTLESNVTSLFGTVRRGTPEPVLTLGDFYCLSDASTGSTCPSTTDSEVNSVNVGTLGVPEFPQISRKDEIDFEKAATYLVALIIRNALLLTTTEVYAEQGGVFNSGGKELTSEDSSVDKETMSTISEPDIPDDVAVTNFVSNLLNDVIENIQSKLFDKKAVGENYIQLKTSTLQSDTSTYTDVDSEATQNTNDSVEAVDILSLEWDDNDISTPIFRALHHPPPITLVYNQDG